ncbi:DUF418 domain-containing protein [Actinomyces sp. 2119]|nr:DUF418 domain-containing protein [Actinomyces sp. 2119]
MTVTPTYSSPAPGSLSPLETAEDAGRHRPARRYQVLDILRGFALCGILLVNIGDIVELGWDLPAVVGQEPSAAQTALHYLVSTRFVPIFAFMFGMSMTFVADSARRRASSPGRVLARRLGVLLVIALAHSLVYPGEVLRAYAIVGLMVLVLVLLLPRRLLALLGVVATAVSYAVAGSGVLNVPGLFLLGAAAAAYGLPAYLERPDRRLLAATVVVALLTVPAVLAQVHEPGGDPRFGTAGGIAGGIMAVLYVCLVVLACSTSLRRPLAALLEPLGRTSLSCYVGASLVVAPIGVVAHWTESRDVVPLLWTALVVLLAQSLLARAWLSRFRYGPLEWMWRCLTWWRVEPLLRR